MFSMSSKTAVIRASTMVPRFRSRLIGRRGGENEAPSVGCGERPEGTIRVCQHKNPAVPRQSPHGAFRCLENLRVGVGDQIRYLGLRVALRDFRVNAAAQRNGEKMPPG